MRFAVAKDKELAKSMLEAIILKHQIAGAVRQPSPAPAAKAAKEKNPSGTKRAAHAAPR